MLIGSHYGKATLQDPMRIGPKQAGTFGVRPDPQTAFPGEDVSNQMQGLRHNLDCKYTGSSNIAKIKKGDKESAAISPFLLTASFLIDVHASKVCDNIP